MLSPIIDFSSLKIISLFFSFMVPIFLQPQEVFESFDPKPLGAASLAQVHKVKLKDGRTIALKVQHPTVKSNSSVDLKTMEVSILSYFICKYFLSKKSSFSFFFPFLDFG